METRKLLSHDDFNVRHTAVEVIKGFGMEGKSEKLEL
jgi:hypothetical protein